MGGVTRTSQADILRPQLPAGKSSPIDTHTASNTMTGGGVGVAWDYTAQWTYLNTAVCKRACSLTIFDEQKILHGTAIPRASTAEDMVFAVNTPPVHTCTTS